MYTIFFDESGKIDRTSDNHSYYGALGCTEVLYREVKEHLDSKGYKTEFHFVKFDLKKVDRYLEMMDYILDKEIHLNMIVVDRDKTNEVATKLRMSMEEIRKLFYIKIPERMIYGIIRHLTHVRNIEIVYDQCSEYESYNLKETLTHQLNSQSLYRNLNGKIKSVSHKDSQEDIMLQIIDIFLGVAGFLMDKKYYGIRDNIRPESELTLITENDSFVEEDREFLRTCYRLKNGEYLLKGDIDKERHQKLLMSANLYSKKNIEKAEFIYRLFDTPEKLEKIKKLDIYKWSGTHKIDYINFLDSLAEFFQYKVKFDTYNKNKILRHFKDNPEAKIADYRKLLGYGTSLDNLLKRYAEEMELDIIPTR